jgi:hypothetical protein
MKTLSRLFLLLAGVVGFSVAIALVPMAGCSNDNSNQSFDMTPDFALAQQISHVGVTGQTCCMVTRGSSLALYLTNVQVGMVDNRGIQHAATGELHVVNPYGVDYTLGSNVPAFAYQFSPDGTYAMYAVKTSQSKYNYSLQFSTVSSPSLPKPLDKVVIPDGIQDFALNQQSFFSPSGRYLIIGALKGSIANSADLHVVDVRAAQDVAMLGNGAFNYSEVVANDDTMVYENSTASMVPGTPSVAGLYQLNLSVFGNGNTPPALIDQHALNLGLMSDGETILYLRSTGELRMLSLGQHFEVSVAQNVMTFTSGPLGRGPIVWVGTDRSLHVANTLSPEMITLPANSVDPNSPFIFSADATRLYWFKNVQTSNSYGDLYSVSVAPGADRTPNFIGTRVSTQDFAFFQHRMVMIRNVDSSGTGGEMVSAELDGSSLVVLAEGAMLGGLRQSNPIPSPPPGSKIKTGPIDLTPSIPPPVNAVLTNAARVLDPTSGTGLAYAPLNGSSPVVGELSFSVGVNTLLGVLDPEVHAGNSRFSDDGYVLAYVSGAKWMANPIGNFVGTLKLQPTIVDTNPIQPKLDGVAELGPISQRAMFVSAPANAHAGIYYVKY